MYVCSRVKRKGWWFFNRDNAKDRDGDEDRDIDTCKDKDKDRDKDMNMEDVVLSYHLDKLRHVIFITIPPLVLWI